MSRPYLIVPQLIEQPTWGGDYILKLKGWDKDASYGLKKIGQSYELASISQLAASINNSKNLKPATIKSDFHKFLLVSQIEPVNLLIKLNHAFGNSFQIHIKQNIQSSLWKPKPESWYFLDEGFITLGICDGADLKQYKKICIEIDVFMNNLSRQINNNVISLDDARLKAYDFVQERNPWRFVNKHRVHKYDLIDLSIGGVHHSWEKNIKDCPNGNIVFEVQTAESDENSTIRAFDQGKIKNNGLVRKLNIDDYFKYLDNNPKHNNISFLKRIKNEKNLLKTTNYVVDLLEIDDDINIESKGAYNHIYVRDGVVQILGGDTSIVVGRGHSCFIPSSLKTYVIKPMGADSVVIKTFPLNH